MRPDMDKIGSWRAGECRNFSSVVPRPTGDHVTILDRYTPWVRPCLTVIPSGVTSFDRCTHGCDQCSFDRCTHGGVTVKLGQTSLGAFVFLNLSHHFFISTEEVCKTSPENKEPLSATFDHFWTVLYHTECMYVEIDEKRRKSYSNSF